jgi:hypothetical protein
VRVDDVQMREPPVSQIRPGNRVAAGDFAAPILGIFRSAAVTLAEASQRTHPMMMDGMTSGMMWGMGLFWLLVVIVLILIAAALIKYLRS